MSIRVRGGSYQVRVQPFADQTFPTRQSAETAELELKLRKKLGRLYQEKPTMLGDEIAGFLERKYTRTQLRAATVAHYEDSARPWHPLRNVPLCHLTRSSVEDHVTRRAKKAPVAARNELQLLKAVLREATSRGQEVDPGILAIPAIHHKPAEGQVLELDQLRAIRAWLPERIGRVVPFVGSVGLRFSEAFNLSDSMVDLEAGELRIPALLNKSRRPKPIPLARYEVQLLREQMLARPAGTALLFPNGVGSAYSQGGWLSLWHPALKQVGLQGFKFHWLRHTAISAMCRAGMPVELVALRVGHSDGGALILKRYRHLYPSEARAAVGLLDVFMELAEKRSDPDGAEADTA